MEEDEGASLFDGMEFVSSDALASPTHDASIAAIDAEIDDLLQPSSAGPKSIPLHADSSDTANSASLEAGRGSNKSLSSPLDAELFSAALTSDPILTLPSEALTKETSTNAVVADVGSDKKVDLQSAKPASSDGVSLESLVTSLNTSAEAPVAPPPGIVKKKKKSIMIGYARDSSDAPRPEQTPAAGSEINTAASSSSILSSLEALSQSGSVLTQDSATGAAEPDGKEHSEEASKEGGDADVAGEGTDEEVEEIEMEAAAAAEQRQEASVRVQEEKERKQVEASAEEPGEAEEGVELLASNSLDRVVAKFVTEGKGDSEGGGGDRFHDDAQQGIRGSTALPEQTLDDPGKAETDEKEAAEASQEAAQAAVPASSAQEGEEQETDESDLPGPASELRKEARRVLSSLAARLGSVRSRSREVALARKKAAQMRRQAAARAAAASARLVEVEAELAGRVGLLTMGGGNGGVKGGRGWRG